MYPNVENMIVMPTIERTEITISIQVCLISRMNFDYTKKGGQKVFLANPKINIVYPNVENMIVMPITKRMEIVMSVQVCLISRINIDYKENGGKKAFLANPKHHYHVSQCGEHDRPVNNKKNGDYYESHSLYHFTNEL